jgi:hypothetical protein
MSTSKDFASVLMLDGLALDGARPMIPATWPALMRGEGIFEAFLVNDSCPPAMLDDHDARLCLSRAVLQRAREIATEAGAFEALLLTIDGDVAEGTSTNIFVYANGKLTTPALSRGILGGVTRLNILRSCEAYGIACEESRLELDALGTAEEVYISNAVIGLIPVTKILKIRGDYPGVKGSKLIEIRKAYHRFLESTIT